MVRYRHDLFSQGIVQNKNFYVCMLGLHFVELIFGQCGYDLSGFYCSVVGLICIFQRSPESTENIDYFGMEL